VPSSVDVTVEQPLSLTPAQRHAGVLGVDDDTDAPWREMVGQPASDLFR
jgi:hypothetical protein